MTCLRETATNAHNLDRLDMANHDAILLGWNKCKRNIAYGMFLVGHSSMGHSVPQWHRLKSLYWEQKVLLLLN